MNKTDSKGTLHSILVCLVSYPTLAASSPTQSLSRFAVSLFYLSPVLEFPS